MSNPPMWEDETIERLVRAVARTPDVVVPRQPGDTFGDGRYRVERLLGVGGQKVVYLVRDEALDRPCALSLIQAQPMAADQLDRFRAEVRAMAQFGAQANIVTVYDIGDEDGLPFLLCEYLEGGDLRELLASAAPLPIERALAITRDVCRALVFAHARGVVHRDVTPANIWLQRDGAAKLGDFGLALVRGQPRHTTPGQVLGTAAYLAPEQARGEPVDARGDLYALGCVLYEMVTGKPPFVASDALAVIAQHIHAEPAPPREANPALSEALASLILDLLAKDPDRRPQSAADVLAALDAPSGATAMRSAVPPGPPKPDLPAIAVLPFRNLGGDPDQDYFSDGITEDIITGLSKYRGFAVIARASTFALKGQVIDAATVGRQLGARYLVEGSVRRDDKRVRVTAELVDATRGTQLWAERFDRALADIFVVQDEISRAILGELAPEFMNAETSRAGRRSDAELDAWDLVLRGRRHLWRIDRENNQEAARYFTEALARASDSGLGCADLALALYLQLVFGWSDGDRSTTIKRMVDVAMQALEADGNDAYALAAGSVAKLLALDHAAALELANKAVSVNPNLALGHSFLGHALVFSGRYREGVAALETCIRLSPRDPLLGVALTLLGLGHYLLGRYVEAEGYGRRVTVEQPNMPAGYRVLAASLAQLGRLDEARRLVRDQLLRLLPGHTTSQAAVQLPFGDNHDGRRHFLQGLSAAGLSD